MLSPARSTLQYWLAICATALFALPGVSSADAFDQLARESATATFTSIEKPSVRERWERYYQEIGGRFQFFDARWSGQVGLARMYWSSGDASASGWAVLRVNDDGRIVAAETTQHAPPTYRALEDIVVTHGGQALDVGTTTAGLTAFSMVEANPILNAVGVWPALALKLAIGPVIRHGLPFEHCTRYLNGHHTAAWGAGAWNIGIMAGASWGVALVPALAVGAAHLALTSRDQAFWLCLPDDLR